MTDKLDVAPSGSPAPDPFAGPDWQGSGSVGAAAPFSFGPAEASEPTRSLVKISRRKKRRLRRRRRIGLALLVVGGLIALVAACILLAGL